MSDVISCVPGESVEGGQRLTVNEDGTVRPCGAGEVAYGRALTLEEIISSGLPIPALGRVYVAVSTVYLIPKGR